MPYHLTARPPASDAEARQVHKLAHSHHAPADWVFHAQIIVRSWAGQRTRAIAEAMQCHSQTVRERVHAYNQRGIDGLGMALGSGRKPRITQDERSRLIALASSPPPGKLLQGSGGLRAMDESQPANWTLDTLTAAAQQQGIVIHRSQVRQILLDEHVRWRGVHPWGESRDPQFVPKGRRSSPAILIP
jgi:transposase